MKREIIASIAHAINRAYCESLGDDSIPPWDKAPDWQKQSVLAGVDMHLANPDATPEQSHEKWLKDKIANGWTYGTVKDADRKQHPCVRPFEQLPQEQKTKDSLFIAVVHALKDLGNDAEREIASLKDSLSGIQHKLLAAQNKRIPVANPVEDASYDQHVQYIGRRPDWTDTVYGTKLTFTQNQVRALPGDIARKFLRHTDLFRRFDPTLTEEAAPAPPIEDNTKALLERARIEQEQKIDKENEISNLIVQVNEMTKAALSEFALNNYKHQFKAKETLADMRTQTINLINQFGIP